MHLSNPNALVQLCFQSKKEKEKSNKEQNKRRNHASDLSILICSNSNLRLRTCKINLVLFQLPRSPKNLITNILPLHRPMSHSRRRPDGCFSTCVLPVNTCGTIITLCCPKRIHGLHSIPLASQIQLTNPVNRSISNVSAHVFNLHRLSLPNNYGGRPALGSVLAYAH